jgi:hypothetical protein
MHGFPLSSIEPMKPSLEDRHRIREKVWENLTGTCHLFNKGLLFEEKGELQRWRQGLEEAEACGTFFAHTLWVLMAGRPPEKMRSCSDPMHL